MMVNNGWSLPSKSLGYGEDPDKLKLRLQGNMEVLQLGQHRALEGRGGHMGEIKKDIWRKGALG